MLSADFKLDGIVTILDCQHTLEFFGLSGIHGLEVYCPAWEVSGFNGIPQVSNTEIWVFTRHFHCLFLGVVPNALVGDSGNPNEKSLLPDPTTNATDLLDVMPRTVSGDCLEGVTGVAVHMSESRKHREEESEAESSHLYPYGVPRKSD